MIASLLPRPRSGSAKWAKAGPPADRAGSDASCLRGGQTRIGRRLSLAALLTVTCALAFASLADASHLSHVPSITFGAATSTPPNPYPLADPAGVAVDETSGPSTHDVYVTDPANHRVEKFSPSGEFLLMFGSEVDQTTGGDLCPEHQGDVCQAGGSASSPGAFVTPAFIVVDNSSSTSAGDVYVGDTGNNLISKFGPSGRLITTWGNNAGIPQEPLPNGQLNGPPVEVNKTFHLAGIAIEGSNGQLDVANTGEEEPVFEFTSDGAYLGSRNTFAGNSPHGIAVDAEGYVYVINVSLGVEKFSPFSFGNGLEELGTISSGASAVGLTIDQADNHLYVDNAGTSIQEYLGNSITKGERGTGCTGCTPADVFGWGALHEASGVAADSSNGTIYVADTGDHQVSAYVSAEVADVTTGRHSNLTETSAKVSGEIVPQPGERIAECYFEYSLATVPCSPAAPYEPSDATPIHVSAEITGLTANTSYSYRLVAVGAKSGSVVGVHRTLTTSSAVLGLETLPPTEVGPRTATLNASLNPQGMVTHYYFEYENEGNLIDAPASPAVISSNGTTEVQVPISGLKPHHTYVAYVIAQNAAGLSFGEGEVLETLVERPSIDQTYATDVHTDVSTVHAQLNPGNGVTAAYVEYGSSDCSLGACASSAAQTVKAGETDVAVSAALRDLSAGSTYHYRVVAENDGGVARGPDRTFTTFPALAFVEACPNAHVRQQTGSAFLLDCRAYELVSAVNTGGYDVESSLVAGQDPYGGYPYASGDAGTSRLLYGVHNGGIPGTGHPTNDGVDPYVATRAWKAGPRSMSVCPPTALRRRVLSLHPWRKLILASKPLPSLARISVAPASPTALKPGSRSTFQTAAWGKGWRARQASQNRLRP